MRSYRFDDLTGVESLRLHEEDLPTPQRGELLLRVLAVALNHRDIAMLHGTYPRPPEKGLIPVSDAAAEVVAVGEDVEDVAVGDRVVEVGGPATIAQSLAAVASGGEITLVGFLGTGGAGIDYFDLLRATASVRSVSVGDRVALQEVVRVVAATGLRPVVDRVFGFDEAPAAFAHLESGRHLGKIVISVHPD